VTESPRVLVIHNRYRAVGGEERAVELQVRALERAGVPHRLLLRDSAPLGSARAATAMLRGGDEPEAVADAARELGATVVHCHNMHPLLGPRSLVAAREAGARVVLSLHNFRLFCAIGTAFRDGAPCFRCRERLTVPGLALNCRQSVPEAVVYAIALARHQPAVLDSVDRFLAPSRYAVGQLVRLGLPAARAEPLAHYLPDERVAERSSADRGTYAVAVGRLAPEKGLETAIEAARMAGVPLKIAGAGPLAVRLEGQVERTSAPVELLGRVDVGPLLAEAALCVVPSLGGETFGYSALEAMGAGVPVVASRTGGLPELVGEERCIPRGDAQALASAMGALWRDPERRRSEGDALIARVRERFGEERYVSDLLAVYARWGASTTS
jgi:glycosyltransferase involved in cell wall biosynthesis